MSTPHRGPRQRRLQWGEALRSQELCTPSTAKTMGGAWGPQQQRSVPVVVIEGTLGRASPTHCCLGSSGLRRRSSSMSAATTKSATEVQGQQTESLTVLKLLDVGRPVSYAPLLTCSLSLVNTYHEHVAIRNGSSDLAARKCAKLRHAQHSLNGMQSMTGS